MKWLIARRIALSLFIGIIAAVGINELSFYFLKSEAGRPPKRVELTIPPGTAAEVAQGKPNPALPANMVFVIGDTLVVNNDDSESHTLGPLFVPPGASVSLVLDTANSYAYSCSFQPGQYLGLDVREPVTNWTRIYGILFAGIPLGGLLGIYSLIIFPIKKPESLT